jgi:hypothetical protein
MSILALSIVGIILVACEPIGDADRESVEARFLLVRPKDIRSVELAPIPEGPPRRFSRNARGPIELPLKLIADALPARLPPPLPQGSNCEIGTLLTFRLMDGTEVPYGPCRRPPAIEQLRHIIATFDVPPSTEE